MARLLTSEIVPRLFKRPTLSEKFFDRYAIVVLVVCLGGTLMGGLLAATLGLDGALAGRSVAVPELILAASATGVMGAGVGGGLGFVKGLILAAPLAAILGLFRRNAN